MKKMITLLAIAGMVLALAPAAQAAIIKVDNRNAAPSVAGWNVADSKANSPFVFGGLTFTYTGGWNDSGYQAEGAFDGTFWDDVAADRFYVNKDTTGSIAISGLNDALTYNLQLVGSDDNSNRAGDYKVNDSFGDVAGPLGGDGYDAELNGYDNADVMTFSNVSPISGVITITVTPEPGSNNPAILGAFTIETPPRAGTVILFK